jgi:hypothetical protein
VYEMQTLEVADVQAPRRLYLQDYRCPTADCDGLTHPYGDPVDPIGEDVLWFQPMSPAMSVHRRTATGAIKLELVWRGRAERTAPYCGSDTVNYDDLLDGTLHEAQRLDLFHQTVSADPLAGTLRYAPADLLAYTPAPVGGGGDACEDRNRPSIVTPTSGRTRACWRYADRSGGGDHVHCVTERCVTCSPRWASEVELGVVDQPDPGLQDHPSVAVGADGRIVAHHSEESVSAGLDGVRLQFPDAPAAPTLLLGSGPVDQPDVSQDRMGRTHVVWDERGGASAKIWIRSCEADCTDLANWDPASEVVTDNKVRFPTLVTDGNRQLVTYMMDVDPTSAESNRVMLATRCVGPGATPWSTSEVRPLAAPDEARDQVLFWGEPLATANRVDNLFHVVFVEADEYVNIVSIPTDATLWWATTAYDDCPE